MRTSTKISDSLEYASSNSFPKTGKAEFNIKMGTNAPLTVNVEFDHFALLGAIRSHLVD